MIRKGVARSLLSCASNGFMVLKNQLNNEVLWNCFLQRLFLRSRNLKNLSFKLSMIYLAAWDPRNIRNWQYSNRFPNFLFNFHFEKFGLELVNVARAPNIDDRRIYCLSLSELHLLNQTSKIFIDSNACPPFVVNAANYPWRCVKYRLSKNRSSWVPLQRYSRALIEDIKVRPNAIDIKETELVFISKKPRGVFVSPEVREVTKAGETTAVR